MYNAAAVSAHRPAMMAARSWSAAAAAAAVPHRSSLLSAQPSHLRLLQARSHLHTAAPLHSNTGLFSLPLPLLGSGVHGARVSRWFVAPGDSVQPGQPLCTIETAVGNADIAAPDAATVAALMVAAGDVVLVGHDLITLRAAAPAGASAQPMSMALEQATHIVRLERAYAAATDDAERLDTLVSLLRACNDAGFHARVLSTVELGVTQTMAHDTLVAEQYWRAKDALEPNSPEAQMQAQQQAAAAASAPAGGFAPPPPAAPRPPDGRMEDNVLYVRHAHSDPFEPQGVFSARRLFAREDANRQQLFVILLSIAIATAASVHLVEKTDKSALSVRGDIQCGCVGVRS